MKNLSLLRPAFFMLIFLFFSCTDHEVVVRDPDVETLKYEANCRAQFLFKVNVKDAGSEPVKEYGIVYKRGESPQITVTPTIADTKITFSDVINVGQQSQYGPGECTPVVYYRSYVLLENGKIFYGNLLVFVVQG